MKRRRLFRCLCAAAFAGVAAAEPPDFSRYQVILERKPFGDSAAAPPTALTAEQIRNSFVKDLRLCAIYENEDGVRVGFLNIKNNPPTSFILRLEETTDDGIQLVDADYESGSALLRKGNEEYWISIGNELNVAAGSAPPALAASSPGGIPSAQARESYIERLRKRREALRAPAPEPPKLTGEELRRHLEEYQMELIRAGGEKGPPLPIPLTPEMDAKLVEEGVLPPQ